MNIATQFQLLGMAIILISFTAHNILYFVKRQERLRKTEVNDETAYWAEQKQNLKKMMQWQKDNAPSAEDQARYYEYQKSKLAPEEFERWVDTQIEAQASIDKFLKE